MRRRNRTIVRHTAFMLVGMVLAGCRDNPPEATEGPTYAKGGGGGPTVASTDPYSAKRGTTLDVRILGSGFASGAEASFLLGGAPDGMVRTNSTRYVSPTELVANITIDPAAVPNYRDVQVVLLAGKKGIGSELFVVLQAGEMDITGLSNAEAWSVNASGQAVGGATLSGAPCTSRGFTWSQAAGSSMLPLAPGFSCADARLVNDLSTIAGTVATTAGVSSSQVARWTPGGAGAWTVDVLPRPAAGLLLLTVHGLNASGNIVSAWKNPNGTWDSWFWSNGTGWQKLAKPSGATWCSTEDMNDADQIVGFCNGAGGGAVYWASPSSAGIRLPGLGAGISNKASALNNLGVIAGSSLSGSQVRAARWRPNGSGGWFVDDLGVPGNATGLNDGGAIVGLNNGLGFYISAAGVMEMLSPISPPGTTPFINLGNIASDGTTWLVGWGPTNAQGGYRALWWRR